MNLAAPLIGLLFLSLTPLPGPKSPCPSSNLPSPTSYQFRKDDPRCEGILPPNISSGFNLVSFTIGRLEEASNLSLQVPNVKFPNGQLLPKPTIRILADDENYQLDPINPPIVENQFKFQWSSDVLTTAKIRLERLRAVAQIQSGTLPVYIPVIWGKTPNKATEYNILFACSTCRIENIAFEIFPKGTKEPIYKEARKTGYRQGQPIRLTWNGRKQKGSIAPTGQYHLYVTYKLLTSPLPQRSSFIITHDSKWLNR